MNRNEATKARQRRKRADIIDHLGGVCVRCGFSDSRALQIDHVHGGGRLHRQRVTSLYQFYAQVMKFPNDFQLLCANCNAIKRIEDNENR